jgi:hypothetical protein
MRNTNSIVASVSATTMAMVASGGERPRQRLQIETCKLSPVLNDNILVQLTIIGWVGSRVRAFRRGVSSGLVKREATNLEPAAPKWITSAEVKL